jgi:hypothetical protein
VKATEWPWPDDEYLRSRARAKRRPTWWLRRKLAHIVAIRPRPSDEQIQELLAIRRELKDRREGAWWRTISGNYRDRSALR